ncbi:hypothetical protein BHE74_00002364 [Ensete ventricosum]|nr:hypothetical protein BHE74_00002364 [Ensete ventricosum]
MHIFPVPPLHSFGRETADALNYSLSARRYTLSGDKPLAAKQLTHYIGASRATRWLLGLLTHYSNSLSAGLKEWSGASRATRWLLGGRATLLTRYVIACRRPRNRRYTLLVQRLTLLFTGDSSTDNYRPGFPSVGVLEAIVEFFISAPFDLPVGVFLLSGVALSPVSP